MNKLIYNCLFKAQSSSLEEEITDPPRWTFASSIFRFLEKSTDEEDEWVFAKDGKIVMTLMEITFEDDEAILRDPSGKFYLLQNGALWSGNSISDISNFVAEGAFDETESRISIHFVAISNICLKMALNSICLPTLLLSKIQFEFSIILHEVRESSNF